MGQKVVFWVRKRCFWVFWTGCEVADLKERHKTTSMDHRNKIHSLVLPTDDPGDAPDCITENGPYTCEYGRICPTAPTSQKYGVALEPTLHLTFLVRQELSKSMPATKHDQQRLNRKNYPGGPDKGSTNIFLRNVSVLDEGDCQTAWLFAHWGPFSRQRHGAEPPNFHMHTGKIGQFFGSMGVPRNQRWTMRRWSPQYHSGPPEHPRDTSHTFSLAASGSQSAL